MLTYKDDLLPKKILTTNQNLYHVLFSDELSLSPNFSAFISFQISVPMNLPAVILALDLTKNC